MILTDAEAQDFVSRMGSFLYTSFLPRELAIQATVTPPLHLPPPASFTDGYT